MSRNNPRKHYSEEEYITLKRKIGKTLQLIRNLPEKLIDEELFIAGFICGRDHISLAGRVFSLMLKNFGVDERKIIQENLIIKKQISLLQCKFDIYQNKMIELDRDIFERYQNKSPPQTKIERDSHKDIGRREAVYQQSAYHCDKYQSNSQQKWSNESSLKANEQKTNTRSSTSISAGGIEQRNIKQEPIEIIDSSYSDSEWPKREKEILKNITDRKMHKESNQQYCNIAMSKLSGYDPQRVLKNESSFTEGWRPRRIQKPAIQEQNRGSIQRQEMDHLEFPNQEMIQEDVKNKAGDYEQKFNDYSHEGTFKNYVEKITGEVVKNVLKDKHSLKQIFSSISDQSDTSCGQNDIESKVCKVCFGRSDRTEMVKMLHCKHYIHKKCLKKDTFIQQDSGNPIVHCPALQCQLMNPATKEIKQTLTLPTSKVPTQHSQDPTPHETPTQHYPNKRERKRRKHLDDSSSTRSIPPLYSPSKPSHKDCVNFSVEDFGGSMSFSRTSCDNGVKEE
ncbi:unnamed protein product [Moneuplotes crassus]|uniref:RING-type domain-containing protein n=1 Tax=Euplotes crassus TaxID=5936 RepID=A0AAD1UE90_EUPCR|nr:unnamed protein product [Moneuplotes crassus]